MFICECNKPSFDVLLGDFDYTQELGSPILNPKSTGTQGFRVPHVSKLMPNKLNMLNFKLIIKYGST